MNKLDKAMGGEDVIDVITNIVDGAKRKAQAKIDNQMTDRKAINILNDVIRMLNKNKCYESAEELDLVRQWVGRDL